VHRILYGVILDGGNEELILMPMKAALELAEVQRAIWQSQTWGEFRRRVSVERYNEVLESREALSFAEFIQNEREHRPDLSDRDVLAEYQALPIDEREPSDDDPFAADAIPGVSDGFWPEWPAQQMLAWFPKEIAATYGEVIQSLSNGYFLDLPSRFEDEIVQSLQRCGFDCSRDDETMMAASGVVKPAQDGQA
jgi:hypothetical protein